MEVSMAASHAEVTDRVEVAMAASHAEVTTSGSVHGGIAC